MIALCENGHGISKALSKAIESKVDAIMKDEELRYNNFHLLAKNALFDVLIMLCCMKYEVATV